MVTFLPTPIGNLQDITLHSLEALERCEVLLCEDTRVSKKLILLLQEKTLLDKKEYEYYAFHTHNQMEFLEKTPKDFFLKDIAFLSDAGMPCISDPGVELVRYLQMHDLPYEVLGGISAVTLVVALSGMVEKEFSFLGFPPHKLKERTESFLNALKSPYPIVFYESPHRLIDSLEIIERIDSTRIVFLAKELTKKYQQSFKGTIKEILKTLKNSQNSALLKGEWAMVIDKVPSQAQEIVLRESEVLSLDIPPKIKAKILAKMSGENGKKASDFYKILVQ